MKERTRNVNWRAAALGGSAGIVGILLASGMVCALASRLGGGGEVEGALAAGGELVVLTILNGALCGWKMEGVSVTILVLAGGCGAAMLLTMNRGYRRKRRRRR